MKSLTIIAFGLLVFVAAAMSNPVDMGEDVESMGDLIEDVEGHYYVTLFH